jgi:hypothetical protein
MLVIDTQASSCVRKDSIVVDSSPDVQTIYGTRANANHTHEMNQKIRRVRRNDSIVVDSSR